MEPIVQPRFWHRYWELVFHLALNGLLFFGGWYFGAIVRTVTQRHAAAKAALAIPVTEDLRRSR